MPHVVLKLFAGQGTGETDGQNGDYVLPPLGSIKMVYYKNCHFSSLYHTILYHTIWFYTIPYHIISYHISIPQV